MELDDAKNNWMASSDEVLGELAPDLLFESADDVTTYKKLHNDLLYRMVSLNGTIVVLEELGKLPLEELFRDNFFWNLFIENFYDSAFNMMYTLVLDQHKNSHTIGALRAFCFKAKWKDPQLLARLEGTLRERKMDDHSKELKTKVTKVRHNHIAHRPLVGEASKLIGAPGRSSVAELRNLYNDVQLVFGALTFGSACYTLTLDLLSTTVGCKPVRTSVESFFDAVLKDNEYVTMPERTKNRWQSHRNNFSESDLRILNELRLRAGLPEA